MSTSSPLDLFPDRPDPRARMGDWLDRLASRLASRIASRIGRVLVPRLAVWVGMACLLAVAVVVVAVVWVGRGGAPRTAAESLPMAGGSGSSAATTIVADATSTTGATGLVVQAAGAVARPGVFRLRERSRVGDLVEAAGGLLPEADVDRINLASPLADGARVYFLRRGEAEPGPVVDGGAGAGVGATGPPPIVDLNSATADQLVTLPGVGPSTAAAIIDERRRARFRSVDDLARVRGIGPAKLAALRGRVRV